MEFYLFGISVARKGKALDHRFFDECLTMMEENIKNSTRYHFTENHFYRELPPKLQHRLTLNVLGQHRQTLEYFFEDFRGKNKAP